MSCIERQREYGSVLEEKHGGTRRDEESGNIIRIYCMKIIIFNERKK